MHRLRSLSATCASLLLSTTALAQSSTPATGTDDSPVTSTPDVSRLRDLRAEIPIAAYAYGAYGVSRGVLAVQAYGLGLAAPGQDQVVSGGGTIWGSPVDRLTIVVDGQRNLSRDFS